MSALTRAEADQTAASLLRVGTAGWSVPRSVADSFPTDGSHLQRYATRLLAAEINSSFYRPHRRTTYERWAASVGPEFRFSVKLPKAISHAISPNEQEELATRFAEEVHGLGEKLGVVLVQFPPKHAFNSVSMDRLFKRLAHALPCLIACEPRHASWFTPAADEFLAERRIARVAADPPPVAEASQPGGWRGLRYYRLHGSPVIYRSSYDDATLRALSECLAKTQMAGAETWCIFDNTASSAATGNALTVAELLKSRQPALETS